MSVRLAVLVLYLAGASVAGPAPRFDSCKNGQTEVLACHHAEGRAGASVQVSRCREGRLLAKLMGPGPTDAPRQTDAIVVTEIVAKGRMGAQVRYINKDRKFDLWANFPIGPVNRGGNRGTMILGSQTTKMTCNRSR